MASQEEVVPAHAVIDLSCYDWLNFPHWNKALELDDFPKFLRWLTEQDALLAGMVATRQEEFDVVFQKIKSEMKTATTAAPATTTKQIKPNKQSQP